MADVKVLRYYTTNCGSDFIQLGKIGVAATVQENKAIEQLILPYVNAGYKIVQFIGDLNDCTIVLQKD